MTDPVHVVLGAGQVGSAIARLLLARGEGVGIGTRSGSLPPDPGLQGALPVAVDVSDPAALRAATRGARSSGRAWGVLSVPAGSTRSLAEATVAWYQGRRTRPTA